jgi:outer membrane protein insertion porin family
VCAPPAAAQDYDDDLPAILGIKFRGNATFGSNELLKQTTIEFPSLTHPLRSRPRFRRNGMSKELRRVEEFYRRQGFGGVNVSVDSVVAEVRNKGVRLYVGVREGPRTRIRELRFLPQPVFSLEELRAVVPFKTGDPYPFSSVERGRATRALRLAFLTRGYLAVSVADSTALGADSTSALLMYRMTPGKQFTVRAVSISGNLSTRPEIVQREIEVQPGQIYSYEKVENSRQRLYSTGLFRSVKVSEEDPDSVATTVDLAIRLVERQNRFVEGAVGFGRSDFFEVQASAGWGHRNLWGRGHGFGVRTEVAYNLEEGGDRWYNEDGVYYVFPRMLGTRTRFTPDVTFLIDHRQSEVHLQEWQINAPFAYEIGRFTSVGLGATLAFTKTSVENIADRPENTLETRLLYAAMTQNYTNNVLNPRTGDVRSIRLERAGGALGGDNNFTRVSGLYTRYLPFGPMVLALGLRGGWVKAFGESRSPQRENIGIQGVPFEYLFQAGGSSTVRGFDNYSLGTKIRVTELNASGSTASIDTVDVQAGTVMLIGNIEVRRPAPWLGRWNIDMAAFLDIGNTWEDWEAVASAVFAPRYQHDYYGVEDLRYGYGFGLRYPTPFGPIRADLGFPLKHFGRRQFHFAVGYPF